MTEIAGKEWFIVKEKCCFVSAARFYLRSTTVPEGFYESVKSVVSFWLVSLNLSNVQVSSLKSEP